MMMSLPSCALRCAFASWLWKSRMIILCREAASMWNMRALFCLCADKQAFFIKKQSLFYSLPHLFAAWLDGIDEDDDADNYHSSSVHLQSFPWTAYLTLIIMLPHSPDLRKSHWKNEMTLYSCLCAVCMQWCWKSGTPSFQFRFWCCGLTSFEHQDHYQTLFFSSWSSVHVLNALI